MDVSPACDEALESGSPQKAQQRCPSPSIPSSRVLEDGVDLVHDDDDETTEERPLKFSLPGLA